MSARVLVTGMGALCAVGAHPEEIWKALRRGRSAVAPVRQWCVPSAAMPLAGEIADVNPRTLVADRKIHKLLRRTDFFGLYAGDRAIADAALVSFRATLGTDGAAAFDDNTGVYAASGGVPYQYQYDFFPLMTAAAGQLYRFGTELTATINPMWLLQNLPNSVVCHIGIQYGFKGVNACVTNHSVSGWQALAEARTAVRTGAADRAVVVGHDAPIEPQTVLHYQRLGLLADDAVRPFDVRRSGTALGEGAGALIVEAASAAHSRGAAVLGEILGSGCTSEAQGILAIRADGDGLARAIEAALADAGLAAADVGMIVAHGNGTRVSDASEALAIRRVFGTTAPPVTAFKWSFGHLMAASGVLETGLALLALQRGLVPGIATLREPDPECAGLPVSAAPQVPRTGVALILGRGFAGTNAALLVGAADRRVP